MPIIEFEITLSLVLLGIDFIVEELHYKYLGLFGMKYHVLFWIDFAMHHGDRVGGQFRVYHP